MIDMVYYLGIDPGKTGGYTIINSDGVIVKSWKAKPDDDFGGIDVNHLYHFILEFKDDLVFVVIEDVHSIYGSAAKSNFNFGRNFGEVFGALKAWNFDIIKIKPKEWQKIIWEECDIVYKNGTVKDTKQTSKNAALRIFGEDNCKLLIPSNRSKNMHDGSTDAALIVYSQYWSLNISSDS